MQLIDTHCHIHSQDYPLPLGEVEQQAQAAGVTQLLCVGTDADDSQRAAQFAAHRLNAWASAGLHPHDAALGDAELAKLRQLVADQPNKIVAIGECGLDYFYNHSPKQQQINSLRAHIELALKYNLPMIFHVREAFDDFWPIFDEYPGIRGVIHSFTDTHAQLDALLSRGLYVGVNGIITFTKNDWQLEVAKAIPLDRLLLETDAPFLTPVPLRGKVNQPAHVRLVAEFLAKLRNDSLQNIANATTHNARQLFSI